VGPPREDKRGAKPAELKLSNGWRRFRMRGEPARDAGGPKKNGDHLTEGLIGTALIARKALGGL